MVMAPHCIIPRANSNNCPLMERSKVSKML